MADQQELTLFTGTATPALVIQDEAAYSKFYQDMKAQLAAFVPDLTTDKGRKEIASQAFKVTKTKTAIEAAAKALTEEWRKKTSAANASRNKIVEELDALRDEVRKPLTEWEEAEQARELRKLAYFARLRELETIPHGSSSVYINDTLQDLLALSPSADDFGDDIETANEDRQHAIELVRERLADQVKAEQDAAELAILRRQKEEREAQEAADRAMQAQARLKAEAAERELKDQQEAAERARQEQEERAREEEQRIKDAAAAAERRAREEEQAKHKRELEAVQAEADRLAKIEADRIEKARLDEIERNRVAQEVKRRQENEAHRRRIMSEAKLALMTLPDMTEKTARTVVLALVANAIPHVTIEF